MVKLGGPLLSQTAHGWLGRYEYRHHGLVTNPYPIALLGSLRYPYHMPAWGLRPYPSFISSYYNPRGWTYQRARTWHGCIMRAIRPPISVQPRTSAQTGNEVKFADAVSAWQAMNQEQQDVYKKWRYPVKASGYNRFISWYLRTHVTMPTYWGSLARSESDPAIIADTFVEKSNPQIVYPFQFYNKMAMNMVVHKGAGFPDSPVQGQLFYRSDEDKVYSYDGAAWHELGSGAPGGGAQEADVIVAGDGSGDYTDIQDGIDNLPAGGGYLFIKSGTYTLSTGLVVAKSNVRIGGAGPSTIITQGAAANLQLLTVGDGASEYADIIIEDLTFDGNKANNTTNSGIVNSAKVTNLTLRRLYIHDVPYYGFEDTTGNRSGLLIEDCTFEDPGRNAIYEASMTVHVRLCKFLYNVTCGSGAIGLEGGGPHIVESNYFKGTNDPAMSVCVYTYWATMVNILNNYSDGMLGLNWWYTYFSWPNNQMIVGNYVINSAGDGIWAPYQDGVVANNIVYSCGGKGIYAGTSRSIIVGNNITGAGDDAIYVDGSDNTITNNYIFGAKGHGIIIPYSNENLVQGNRIMGVGSGQVKQYSMIEMQGRSGVGCTRNMIYDNYLYYQGGSYHEQYGIREISTACNYNQIRGNVLKGFFPIAMQVAGSGSDAWDNVRV